MASYAAVVTGGRTPVVEPQKKTPIGHFFKPPSDDVELIKYLLGELNKSHSDLLNMEKQAGEWQVFANQQEQRSIRLEEELTKALDAHRSSEEKYKALVEAVVPAMNLLRIVESGRIAPSSAPLASQFLDKIEEVLG
jgi:hypothetical protein